MLALITNWLHGRVFLAATIEHIDLNNHVPCNSIPFCDVLVHLTSMKIHVLIKTTVKENFINLTLHNSVNVRKEHQAKSTECPHNTRCHGTHNGHL